VLSAVSNEDLKALLMFVIAGSFKQNTVLSGVIQSVEGSGSFD
jgi:hypothetical protein